MPSGEIPHDPTESSSGLSSVVFALDLTLLVPFLVLGAYWLWNRRPWGFVLGVVLTIKGATYPLALGIGAFAVAR